MDEFKCIGGDGMRSLVVDDNLHNRKIFRIALETAGYQVMEAENGALGFAAFQAEQYDLLIIDLAMPVMDGVQFLTQAHQLPSWNNPTVIVVTANPHMTTEDVNDMADYILYKPIDVQSFKHLVERVMQSS
jgi:two-component system, chemotaxis family, chemotaxis protein CheY